MSWPVAREQNACGSGNSSGSNYPFSSCAVEAERLATTTSYAHTTHGVSLILCRARRFEAPNKARYWVTGLESVLHMNGPRVESQAAVTEQPSQLTNSRHDRPAEAAEDTQQN